MKDKATQKLLVTAAASFACGFILGAVCTAIFDYRDEKQKTQKKLRRDVDENYYYSVK